MDVMQLTELDGVLLQQIVSASLGGTLVALVVNPFDVLKTRLQAQIGSTSSLASGRVHASTLTGSPVFRDTKDALVKIMRHEGLRSLWTGLCPSLLLIVPSSAMYLVALRIAPHAYRYFTVYEQLKTRIERHFVVDPTVSAIFAGGCSRLITATVTSPLELVRTNLQSRPASSEGILHLLRKIVHLGGWRRLYAGLPPTLLRDAPFSAIYWSSYEAIKRSHFLRNQNTFMTAFISGAASGTFAAILTNPIDVIKTRRQMLIHANLQSYPVRLSEIFRTVLRDEGWSGFMKGVVPRAAKVAPACAIMISTYEVCKGLLSGKI